MLCTAACGMGMPSLRVAFLEPHVQKTGVHACERHHWFTDHDEPSHVTASVLQSRGRMTDVHSEWCHGS